MGRLVDTQAVMNYLDLTADSASAAQLVPDMLAAAEDFIELYTKRQFAPEPALPTDPAVTKVFPYRKRHVRIADLRVAVGPPVLLQDGATLQAGSYRYGPGSYVPGYGRAPVTDVWLYTGASSWAGGELSITGHWGWYPLPNVILDAVKRLTARLYAERDARYSDSVVTADGGVLQYFRQLPAHVQASVDLLRVRQFGFVRAGVA